MRSWFLALVVLLSLVATVLSASTARADLFFEPYAKYSMGQFESTTSGTTTTYDGKGYGAGARFGFHFDRLFIAADYGNVFSGKLSTTGSVETDLSEQQLGVVLGTRLFMRARAWVGYDFINELSSKSTTDTTKYYDGNAMKAGLGYFIFRPVSLNVEYVMSTYKRGKDSNGDYDFSANDLKGHAVVISLSAPLEL